MSAAPERGFATVEPREGRSLIDLLKELRDETLLLFRQEIDLAKAEVAQKVSRVARNLAYLAIGAVVALVGAVFILVAIGFAVYVGLTAGGLTFNVAAWLAPLIVGLVGAGVGVFLVLKALATLRREPLLPAKTVETLKEDKEWLAQRTR